MKGVVVDKSQQKISSLPDQDFLPFWSKKRIKGTIFTE